MKTMGFMEAYQKMREGRKVARLSWKNKYAYFTERSLQSIEKGDHAYPNIKHTGEWTAHYEFIAWNDFVEATDWIEVEESEVTL